MGNEVNEVINNICAKLGYAATEITPEFAKYSIVQNAFGMALCVVFGLLFAVMGLKACKSFKALDEHDREWDSFPQIMGMILGAVGLLIVTVIFFCDGADLVGWIVAPKASMMRYVLHLIH